VHRIRATLNVAVLVTAFLLLAGPAAGGGPTSALLSVPGEGKTASLYYTDPEYAALADLVGIESETGTGTADRSGLGHENGPGVTVTWLIHDVTPWRVDHIYLAGDGAPWIATQIASESGTIWDTPVVWHQPASGNELGALLDQLGVGEAAREAGNTVSGVAGPALPPPVESTPDTESSPVASSSLAGIRWGLGGLAAGVLLAVLWMRRSRGDSNPAADFGGQRTKSPGLVVGEELSST
jgi:hypothetical protein